VLRGLNRSGLEYAHPVAGDFLRGAGITDEELDTIVGQWGANVIRVPFNQARVLADGRPRSTGYLASLDRLIARSARRGAYVLLTLQWLDSETSFGIRRDGSPNRIPPLPNLRSLEVWGRLAARYRDEPAVLFDLFTEPHDPVRDSRDSERDDRSALIGIADGGDTYHIASGRVSMHEWQQWARHLVRVIRREHPHALVFVSGVNWAYDLRGFPLCESRDSARAIEGLVYSTHVYPWRGGPSRLTNAATFFGRVPTWRAAFGDLARRWPVFAGEWGGDAEHVPWGRRLRAYMDSLEMGWTAWSWSDRPFLVADLRSADTHPTEFGRIVQDGLRRA
jgi:hypothetical protein